MAHQELHESQQTSQGAGYHATNNVFVQTADESDLQQETADAIEKLATATAADRATVATLINTNTKLTQELITVNSKLFIACKSTNGLLPKSEAPAQNRKRRGPTIATHAAPSSGIWATAVAPKKPTTRMK